MKLALIHSPVVGPDTWRPVAEILRRSGHQVVVPELRQDESSPEPFWYQQAKSAADALGGSGPHVLVAHSGSGPLVPGIRELGAETAGYIFVDATIPDDGASRLDLLGRELPDAAREARAVLERGARLPAWSDAELADAIPDPRTRALIIANLRPQPLRFYDEPIPVFDGWPDAPCGYIRLGPAYAHSLLVARSRGWTVRELDAEHFHLVVDPDAVARLVLDVATTLGTA